MAGMLLGELGADVVKIMPPAVDPVRRRPPSWGGAADPERALGWLAHNTSKRGITLDLDRPAGRDLFLGLCERADVVLETEAPGALAARGVGWDVLHARNPRLILCSLTPFGRTGPLAAGRGSDLTVLARSGNLYCTGDPDRAPLRCTFPAPHYHGGIEAAVGVVSALLARERTGQGQHVDVARQEAMIMPNIGTASMTVMTGNRGQRSGASFRQAKSVQREIWPCKDGHGLVRAARRPGPHAGTRRHDAVHGGARHGIAEAAGHGLEGVQPQPALAGRSGRVVRRVQRLLPHQDHDRAVPGGLHARPHAGAGRHPPRNPRLRTTGRARLLRRPARSGPGNAARPRPVRPRHVRRPGCDGRGGAPSGAAARRTHGRRVAEFGLGAADVVRLRAEGVV